MSPHPPAGGVGRFLLFLSLEGCLAVRTFCPLPGCMGGAGHCQPRPCGVSGHICQESPFKDTLSQPWTVGPGHASVMKATAQQGSRSGTSGTSSPESTPAVKSQPFTLSRSQKSAAKGRGQSFSLGCQNIFKNILNLLKNSDMLCICLKMPRESARYCRACPEAPSDRRGLSEPDGPRTLPCQCVDLFTLHTLTPGGRGGRP